MESIHKIDFNISDRIFSISDMTLLENTNNPPKTFIYKALYQSTQICYFLTDWKIK